MIPEMIGSRFGRLLVLNRVSNSARGDTRWACVCDCGTHVERVGADLRAGKIKSCGCLSKDNLTTHGMTGTPEYFAWGNMIQRCTNPQSKEYQYYGARGILVCSQWIASFEMFLADMGFRPGPAYSIERRNVNGNYEPSNCYWATREEQASNTRRNVFHVLDGVTYTESQLARHVGLGINTLRARLAKGESIETAVRPSSRKPKQ